MVESGYALRSLGGAMSIGSHRRRTRLGIMVAGVITALVALGFGSLPHSLTTPILVAKGYGQVPPTLTTPPLVARGSRPTTTGMSIPDRTVTKISQF